MAINKVVFGNEVQMDLTEDTVTEDKVLEGETFHDRSGNRRTGNLVIPVQDVEVNGESVVNENGIAEVVVPVSGNMSTTDSFESYTGGKVKSVQMELSPIQDLHGYPEPWVGGAGKNKLGLIFTENPSSVAGMDFTHTESSFTLKGTSNSGAYNIFSLNYLPNFKSNTRYCLTAIVDKGSFNGLYISISFRKDGAQVKRVTMNTGSTLSVPFDNVPEYDEVRFILEAIPASTQYDLEARIQIEEGNVFTTFEPYSNICPISGHTQAKLEHGRDFYNESVNYKEIGSIANGTGRDVDYDNRIRSHGYIDFNGKGIISCKESDRRAIIFCYSSDESYIGAIDPWAPMPYTFTTTPNTAKIRFAIRKEDNSDMTIDDVTGITIYEYDTHNVYTINLGGTYYWLRGDTVNGKWYVVGKGKDVSTLIFRSASRNRWLSEGIMVEVKHPSESSVKIGFLSDSYYYTDANTLYGNQSLIGIAIDSGGNLLCRNNDTNPPTGYIVYELATPIPINLDPQQIEAFLGENNFSAPLEQQEIIEIIARNIAEFNEVIDDENISDEFTYSSEKIEDRLDEYVDKDAVEEKSATDEFSTINGGLLSSCKVALSPNQDLHGYAEPWVGGAGKNKLEFPYTDSSKTVSGITYTVKDNGDIAISGTATAVSYFTFNHARQLVGNGQYIFSKGTTDTIILGADRCQISDNAYINRYADNTSSPTTSEITINISDADNNYARFWICVKNGETVNTIIHPMVRLASESDPTFEPYSNICPISGHTQVEVGDDGKNRIPYVELGILNQTDGSEEVNNDNKRTGFIYVPKHGNYTISGLDGSNIAIRIFEYDKNKNYIRNYLSVTFTGTLTIITNENVGYVRFQGNKILFASDTAQLEEGSTATAYVPYNGYQVTVNLGGTYYSGTLDVVSGVLTVTWIKFQITASNGEFNATNNRYIIRPTTIDLPEALVNFDDYNCISDKFVSISARQGSLGGKYGIYANSDVVAICGFKTSLSDYQTWLTNNPVDACYKLDTPLTIQLSPTMVKALVGENHLSAPLDGHEITESKYRELFTWNDVEEIAQKIADSKIDNIYTSYNTTFSSAFTEARYVKKIYGAPVLTALQIVLSGATSVTFNHQLIFSDSQTCCELIQFGSGARIGITDVAISQGSVTFTFDSPLTKAIGFRCRITNDFVS